MSPDDNHGKDATEGFMEDLVEHPAETPEQLNEDAPPIVPVYSGELAPMPEGASPGFWGSIPYFFRVVSARYRRRGIMSNLSWEIREKERLSGESLHDLGEAASPSELTDDKFSAPLATIKGLKDRIDEIRAGQGKSQELLSAEDLKFEELETASGKKISTEQQRIRETQAILTERSAALRIIKSRLTQEQKQLRIVEKQHREQQKTLEKTEDPGLEIVARQTIEQLEIECTSWKQRVANTEAEVETEQEPVDEIGARLEVEKKDLRALQNELSDARQALAVYRRGIESSDTKRNMEITGLEKELHAAMTKLGKVIDDERPESTHKAPYEPFYATLDQHRKEIGILVQKINGVDGDRDNYDRDSYNRGLILLLSSTAGSLLLIAILVLVL